MSIPVFDDLNEGDLIPELVHPPLTRLALALYCGASGDHNPIHVDIDYARNEAGLDDVIGHGMLTMAYLGRMLTNWVPQTNIRHYKTRLHAPTRIGDEITCSGLISEKSGSGEQQIKVELRAETQDGVCLATGEADIVF